MIAGRAHASLLPLRDLLKGIDEGFIALPAFQRDFQWSDSDVRAMLGTVFRGWPAGSLLLMQGRPEYFEVRPLEGAPLADGQLDYVVLDGQQRLTALYHAIYDKGPYVYALDTNRISEWGEEDVEQAVVAHKREEWSVRFATSSAQMAGGLIPIAALSSSHTFFRWRDYAFAEAPLPDLEFQQSLVERYGKVFGGIEGYEFPCVVLPRGLDAAEIARIFERLNRTGTPLTTFDLVVARSYQPTQWNLRDAWEAARSDYPLLDVHLGDAGLPVHQVLSLRTQLNVRQRAVLDMDPEQVRTEWDSAVAAVDAGLRFLINRCRVPSYVWLPYRSQLLPIAAIAGDGLLEAHEERVERWFWETSFSLAFEVAANTEIVAQYVLLQGELRELVGQEHLSTRPRASTLYDAVRRRPSSIYRAFASLLARRDARDLDGSLIEWSPAVDSDGRHQHEFVLTPLGETAEYATLRRVLSFVALSREGRELLKREPQALVGASSLIESQLIPLSELPNPTTEEFYKSRARLAVAALSDLGVVCEWDL